MTVWTDVRQVAACAPLDRGLTAVGTPGGLAVLAPGRAAAMVWTARDGLPATSVRALLADPSGLWVGTDRGAALVAVAPGRLRLIRTVAAPPVRDLVRVGQTLYLATWGGGVIAVAPDGSAAPVGFVEGRRGRAGRSPPDPGAGGGRDRVAALATANGALWVGTAAGLYRLERGRLAPVSLSPGPHRPAITALAAAGGTLYLGTADGLIERGPGGALALGGGDVRQLAVVGGQVIAATMGGGLVRVIRGRLRAVDGGPAGLHLAQAVAVRGGAACAGGLDGLWLRPAGGGWARAQLPASGPPSSNISALAREGNRLWVGTFDRGAAVFEDGRFRPVGGAALDPRVNAIAVDPRARDRVWLATAGGLFLLDHRHLSRMTERDGLPSRNVLSLAWLSDGRLLVGTTRGAALVGRGRPEVVGAKRGLHLGNVWAALEDHDGFVWLGTTTGLYRGRLDAGGGWRRFSLASGDLTDDWVMALCARGRSLWVGTYKGGVTRLDWDAAAADAPMQVTQLGGGWINPGGLTWTAGALHAATMTGLLVGDGAHPGWRQVSGLPGRDVTAVAGASQPGARRWIATRRGLVLVQPTDGG